MGRNKMTNMGKFNTFKRNYSPLGKPIIVNSMCSVTYIYNFAL